MSTSVLPVNEAIAQAPQGAGAISLGAPGLDELLALVGISSHRHSRGEMSGSAEEILNGIRSFVDGLLLRVIASQTRSEFIAARQEVIRQYAGAVTSLARILRIVVPKQVIERVLGESFCELEAEFREHGLVRFGEATKDQAMFTIWTLRRTSGLISKVVAAGPVPENLKSKDIELASRFSSSGLWAQFHLDCLLAAMRFDKTIQLDIMPTIIDGLRAAVNAYGYGRQGLHLRTVEPQPFLSSYQWDTEDQELLDSSMRDIQTETIEWRPETSPSPAVVTATDTVTPDVGQPKSETKTETHKASPIFGTHIREGIEIIKDWIDSRKQ